MDVFPICYNGLLLIDILFMIFDFVFIKIRVSPVVYKGIQLVSLLREIKQFNRKHNDNDVNVFYKPCVFLD